MIRISSHSDKNLLRSIETERRTDPPGQRIRRTSRPHSTAEPGPRLRDALSRPSGPTAEGRDGASVSGAGDTGRTKLRHRLVGYTSEKRPKESDMPSNIDEAKGRTKRAAGELTDDDSLKREGTVDKAAGEAKEAIDKAADKAKHLMENDG